MTGRENGVASCECSGTRAPNLMRSSSTARGMSVEVSAKEVGEEIKESSLQTRERRMFYKMDGGGLKKRRRKRKTRSGLFLTITEIPQLWGSC